jgi:hypothetical protein
MNNSIAKVNSIYIKKAAEDIKPSILNLFDEFKKARPDVLNHKSLSQYAMHKKLANNNNYGFVSKIYDSGRQHLTNLIPTPSGIHIDYGLTSVYSKGLSIKIRKTSVNVDLTDPSITLSNDGSHINILNDLVVLTRGEQLKDNYIYTHGIRSFNSIKKMTPFGETETTTI